MILINGCVLNVKLGISSLNQKKEFLLNVLDAKIAFQVVTDVLMPTTVLNVWKDGM